MKKALGAVFGDDLKEEHFERMQLPGPLGGCGIATVRAYADAAFVATWISIE